MPQIQAQGSKQQRERNRESHYQRAANVAEKNEQDDRDQDDAFGQVVEDGVSGQMYQVAAVEVRHDLHAGRKEMAVEEVDLLMQSREYMIRIRPFAQQYDAGYDIGIVHDLA